MKYILIAIIKVYRRFVSPVLPPSCRYFPTCSEYMLEAVEKKGAMVGLFKGLCRVIRCHPLGGSGFDPVK